MKRYLYLLLTCAFAAACMEQPGEGKTIPESDPADAAATELEQRTLTGLMAFDKRADSTITAAETIIAANRKVQHTPTVHHRENNRRALRGAEYHLDRLKAIRADIERLEVTTEPFSPTLVQKLEDLKTKFDTEKSSLDSSLEGLLYKQPNQ